MSASFENPWFESARPVGDLAGGDLAEHRQAMMDHLRGGYQRAGKRHPRREHVLAGRGEADLSRLFAVQQGGGGRRRADQVVGQQDGPEFATDHLRRLAANMSEIQVGLDAANVQLLLPLMLLPLSQLLWVMFAGPRHLSRSLVTCFWFGVSEL